MNVVIVEGACGDAAHVSAITRVIWGVYNNYVLAPRLPDHAGLMTQRIGHCIDDFTRGGRPLQDSLSSCFASALWSQNWVTKKI